MLLPILTLVVGAALGWLFVRIVQTRKQPDPVYFAYGLLVAAALYPVFEVFDYDGTGMLWAMTGLVLFGGLAIWCLRSENWRLLGAAWLLHAAWDLLLHFLEVPVAAPWHYEWLCLGFDVVVGIFLLRPVKPIEPIKPLVPALLLALCSTGCGSESGVTEPGWQPIELATTASGESNLHAGADGTVYLSWVEYLNDSTDQLRFTRWQDDHWAEARTIATGSDWFVNWADFPSIAAFAENDKQLTAHWLQKSADGTYDYDVRIAQSTDGGETWADSWVLHRDSIAAEHGFVSLVPLPDSRMFATWLDGRHTPEKKPMTLRGGLFSPYGELLSSTQLDERVCDCCQTAAVATPVGVLVAYRDRSEDEHRDIAIVRQQGETWTAPTIPHADNWLIAGCPVNGPALASQGEQVALAWFTAADDLPRVKLMQSADSGASWDEPVVISAEQPLGRVDVNYLPEGDVLVTWLEDRPEERVADIRYRRVLANGTLLPSEVLLTTSAARSSGFPRVVCQETDCWVSWTEGAEATTRVRTGQLTFQHQK